MPLIEGSVDISASRQAVWDLICDVSRYPEIGNMADETVLISEGSFGEGSVYSETGKVALMKSTSEWTVSRFDPPVIQTHVGGDRSMRGELTWTLDEIAPGTTRASLVAEFTMMPKFRPLGVVLEWLFVKRMMTREIGHIRAGLKRIAEAEST